MTTPQPQDPGSHEQQAGQAGAGGNGPWPPIEPTTARWQNRERKTGDSRYAKVLAHRGSYTQFKYGTDTPGYWPGGRGIERLQKCIICSRESGLIAVDVDDEEAHAGTRTGQLVGREQAFTTHGRGYHVLIDARAVPADDWPKQGPYAGGDIKSRGFIPAPGCTHWDGERYEPGPYRGLVFATPELIAAINADRAADLERRQAERAALWERIAAGLVAAGLGYLIDGRGRGGGGGASAAFLGEGGGHDGELAAAVLSMVLRGLGQEQCYEQWLQIAVPNDPGWPWERDDFERHHRSAVRKAEEIRAEESQVDIGDDARAYVAAEIARLPARAARGMRRHASPPALLAQARRWLEGDGT